MVGVYLTVLSVVTAGLVLWSISNAISIILGAPPISSPHHSLLKKVSNKNKILFDLGCGSGRIVVAASPLFRHVYGIEISPLYYLIAKWRTRNIKNVTILYGNFMSADWPKTDFIYCYLLPSLLRKMNAKLKNSKAIILSFGFAIPEWHVDEHVVEAKQQLFIYKKAPSV